MLFSCDSPITVEKMARCRDGNQKQTSVCYTSHLHVHKLVTVSGMCIITHVQRRVFCNTGIARQNGDAHCSNFTCKWIAFPSSRHIDQAEKKQCIILTQNTGISSGSAYMKLKTGKQSSERTESGGGGKGRDGKEHWEKA